MFLLEYHGREVVEKLVILYQMLKKERKSPVNCKSFFTKKVGLANCDSRIKRIRMTIGIEPGVIGDYCELYGAVYLDGCF